jgi:hypothetical protein
MREITSNPAALTATDPDSKIACGIILYLAMRPNSKTLPLASYLIPDVWGIVLGYAMPIKLSAVERHLLGFVLGRSLLVDELRTYANGPKPAHKDRAVSMALAVAKTTNEGDFNKLLSEQRSIIEGKNPIFALSFFKIAFPHLRSMTEKPVKDEFQEIIFEHD